VPEALVLGVTLRAGGPDLALVIALSLANVPEALSGTAGMRLASRSSTYVLILWSGTTLVTAAITALAFYFLSDLGPHATAILKAYGGGALIAMAAESMIPEAFHNGPRYSGVLAAGGFAALILLGELAPVSLLRRNSFYTGVISLYSSHLPGESAHAQGIKSILRMDRRMARRSRETNRGLHRLS
jgi:zinc transporter ZupT